jgi:hypothetical protein
MFVTLDSLWSVLPRGSATLIHNGVEVNLVVIYVSSIKNISLFTKKYNKFTEILSEIEISGYILDLFCLSFKYPPCTVFNIVFVFCCWFHYVWKIELKYFWGGTEMFSFGLYMSERDKHKSCNLFHKSKACYNGHGLFDFQNARHCRILNMVGLI